MRAVFKFFSSLRLTVTLLAFAMVLVFLATFEQQDWGVFEVQKRFFETLICIWHWPARWWWADSLQGVRIPLPGGFLIGGLLLINLCCAHFRYFRASWRKSGIVLIHAGVVLLIVSGFLTAYLQQENYMWINVGGQSDYIESFRERDLVFIDHTDPKTDTVVSIPVSRLDPTQPIHDPALPFTVKTVFYYPNSTFALRSQEPKANLPELPADHGVATNRDLGVISLDYDYANDDSNTASAIVEIDGAQGVIGKWLVSTLFDPRTPAPFFQDHLPQTFTVDGHTWEVALRPRREYLPYTIKLDKFIHEQYPGTDVPKRFESQVHLENPASGENRPVLIYMNHPLRYQGLTFYQQSFAQGDTASQLQVVRNPGAPLPYIAVLLVGIGMAVHFILSLIAYMRREKQSEAAAKDAPRAGKSREPGSPALPQTAAARNR
ncbi:MAG TPA: cytochrome c biogenesis protein ResB [Opitutales bacterium]|jgi:hypothetical protein|nr:cytochrome c biogenesis protein ResB [Opitutales bacterium]